jgi:hypothetical protein
MSTWTIYWLTVINTENSNIVFFFLLYIIVYIYIVSSVRCVWVHQYCCFHFLDFTCYRMWQYAIRHECCVFLFTFSSVYFVLFCFIFFFYVWKVYECMSICLIVVLYLMFYLFVLFAKIFYIVYLCFLTYLFYFSSFYFF